MAGKKDCNICGGHFWPQVFALHVRKCEREKKEAEEGQREYDKEMLDQAWAVLAGMWYLALPSAFVDILQSFKLP